MLSEKIYNQGGIVKIIECLGYLFVGSSDDLLLTRTT